jgi:hypothetical protein
MNLSPRFGLVVAGFLTATSAAAQGPAGFSAREITTESVQNRFSNPRSAAVQYPTRKAASKLYRRRCRPPLRGVTSTPKASEKDEFETTADFHKRLEQLKAIPVVGELKIDSVMATVTNAEASYNADDQLMTVAVRLDQKDELCFDRDICNPKYPVGRRDNYQQFRAQLKMDIATAKRIKPKLAALLVFKLSDPYLSEHSYARRINAELLDVWFYDLSTGEILVKKSNYKPDDKPNSAKTTNAI